MRRSERVHEAYHPEWDLAERWPGWLVLETPAMERGERFQVGRKTVLMNSDGDWRWGMAHVLAHLDLGHHLLAASGFTPAHEADADLLARIRLDLPLWDVEDEWADIPIDGEPTTYLP